MTIALSPVGKMGSRFYFDTKDRTIGERITLGKFEPYLTKLLLNNLKEGMVVVDAGANIGYYSILAAKKGCTVFAFEPNIYNYNLLTRNIKLNNLEKLIKPFKLALGDSNKIIKLYLSETNLGDHRIFSEKNRSYEEVEMATLDKVLGDTKIDFIKSDTQGAEVLIFDGAKNILQKYKPDILFESWQKNLKLDGYFLYSIDDYLCYRKKFYDFLGESVNVWATKKPLTFKTKIKDFLVKKYIKQVFNLPRT